MHRSLSYSMLVTAAALLAVGCGFQHTTNVLAPTSATAAAVAGTTSGNTGTTTSSSGSSSSLVGTWASTTSATAPVSASSCSSFQYQITTQTASNIAGTFAATCGTATLTGIATGTINGTAVALTATGTAVIPGVPSCPFTLQGNGSIIDNGTTLNVPFTGTTCQGPVSGTAVLHKPQSSVTFTQPTDVSPTPNAFISTLRPTFTVNNAAHSGPVGTITYTIEVATDEAFSNMYATWTAPEGANQTTFTMPKDLAYTQVYFWHVRAQDPNNNGPFSVTQAMQVTNAPAPPAPVVGGDQIDLHGATITGGSPGDVANWAVTTQITALDFEGNGLSPYFTKKDGPGRWPDVVPPGWTGSIQYTLWMVVNVDGHWYTSGGVEFWYGRSSTGDAPSNFAADWYYSPAVWGPLATHQPQPGEMVGFFVTAGDARAKDVRSVVERSNVVLVAFPGNGGAYFPF
jgi:hypothetical protein